MHYLTVYIVMIAAVYNIFVKNYKKHKYSYKFNKLIPKDYLSTNYPLILINILMYLPGVLDTRTRLRYQHFTWY